jgi:hypothetical protein
LIEFPKVKQFSLDSGDRVMFDRVDLTGTFLNLSTNLPIDYLKSLTIDGYRDRERAISLLSKDIKFSSKSKSLFSTELNILTISINLIYLKTENSQ